MKKKFTFFIILILLLSLQFFYLIPFDFGKVQQIVAILSIIIICFRPNILLQNKGKYRIVILFLSIITVIEIILSTFRYNQNIVNVIKSSLIFFVPLLYFIISYYGKKSDIERIKKIIIFFTIIVSTLLIIQAFLYNNYDITFIKLDLDNSQRFGKVRIGNASMFVALGIILSIGKILNRKYKNETKANIFVLLICIVSGISYLIFVCKTRGILVILTVTIFVMLYLGSTIKEKIRYVISFLIMLILILKMPIFEEYSELSKTAKNSTVNRNNAIEYFIDETNKTPIFGTGIIYAESDYSHNMYILRGPYRTYYRSDVGIVGFYHAYGIIGLMWYGCLIGYVTFNVLKSKYKYNRDSIGILVYLVLSSGTLIIMDTQRIIFLPFILAIIESNN